MTKPTDMATKAKSVLRAVRDGEDGKYWSLMETIGAWFPDSPSFAWLDDENDPTVGAVFDCDETGWIDEATDATLWHIVMSYETDGSDGSPQPVPEELVALLETIAATWQSTPSDPSQSGRQYSRFLSVEPVPGDEYPGWWQGYDTTDEAWKYAYTGDSPPDDHDRGWVAQLPDADEGVPSEALEAVLAETVTSTIEEIRRLGVTEEELSDAEIVDSLQAVMLTELTSG